MSSWVEVKTLIVASVAIVIPLHLTDLLGEDKNGSTGDITEVEGLPKTLCEYRKSVQQSIRIRLPQPIAYYYNRFWESNTVFIMPGWVSWLKPAAC